MKVSIITPCYNDGRFLDEAVRSVEAQTFADGEMLIVDDGSTDPETQRILRDWSRPKTWLLRVPHGGVTAAPNFAVGEARGEYLTFFDCDDRLDPCFLEKTVGRLESKTLRRAALDAMERQLDDAQSSTAWRLPGPLRDALDWARRRKDEK